MVDQPNPIQFSFIRREIQQLVAYSADAEVPDITCDKLDANESAYDLPSHLKEKLTWQYQNLIETNRYPDGTYRDLKSAIAQYVNESSNVSFNAQNISVGNGSDELIRSLLIATCVGTNGSILVADPTFSMYKILAQTLGITTISIPREETHFTIKCGQADQAIAQSSASGNPVKVVFVVHPNSPTGNLLSDKELDWLKQLPEDLLVVIDEAYFEFSQNTLVEELVKHPNWIIVRTFSKAFRLAAHRVGYCVAHPQLIQALEKIRLPYNLPSFSQAAALVALENRQQLLATVEETKQERERLYQAFASDARLTVWPSSANFLYLRCNQSHNEAQLVADLKQQGTLLRYTANGIRLTIGSPQQNEHTQQRLTAYLNQGE